jgi:hypothetical protein
MASTGKRRVARSGPSVPPHPPHRRLRGDRRRSSGSRAGGLPGLTRGGRPGWRLLSDGTAGGVAGDVPPRLRRRPKQWERSQCETERSRVTPGGGSSLWPLIFGRTPVGPRPPVSGSPATESRGAHCTATVVVAVVTATGLATGDPPHGRAGAGRHGRGVWRAGVGGDEVAVAGKSPAGRVSAGGASRSAVACMAGVPDE